MNSSTGTRDTASVTDALTNITWVGQDIGRDPVWLAAVSAALGEAGVAWQRLTAGQHQLTALVPREAREMAMRAAHGLVETH